MYVGMFDLAMSMFATTMLFIQTWRAAYRKYYYINWIPCYHCDMLFPLLWTVPQGGRILGYCRDSWILPNIQGC